MNDSVFPEVLTGLLSPDDAIRNAAEEKLGSYKDTEGYGVVLTEFVVGLGFEKKLEHRQLAGTLLKQYIESHWSSSSNNFALPQATDEVKARVRKILPISLKDPQKVIRVGGAYAIAAIAKFDFPDQWPGVFNMVSGALKSNNPDLIHGAMQLLSELINVVSEQQLKIVEDMCFSELLNIFTHSETFSLEIRTRAVSVFNSITALMANMLKTDAKVGHRVGYYVYLRLIGEAMLKALAVPDDGHLSDVALKTEIIKAFAAAAHKFPKQMQKLVPRILTHVGAMMKETADVYSRMIVDGEIDDDSSVDSEILEQLIYALIDFVNSVLGERRYSQLMVEAIPGLVHLLVIFTQIPEEKVDEWSKDVQRYVEDEDVETCVVNVRMSATELLMNLCDHHQPETIVALLTSFTSHMAVSSGRKDAKDPNWWKIREACYTSLSKVTTPLLEVLKEKPGIIDVDAFMLNVLVPDFTTGGPVFLQGHALAFAGRMCSTWGEPLLGPLLRVAATALLPMHHSVIRMCACKAFYNVCDEAKYHGLELGKMCDLKPVVSSLVALGIRSCPAALNMVLSTLSVVIQADPTAAVDSKIVPLVTAGMLKYSGDPTIPFQVAEIIRLLMAVPECREQIQRNMLPTLLSVIKEESRRKLAIRLPPVALEVLEGVIRGSPRPLYGELVQNGFPKVVQCVLTSDDSHTLAAGRECIRAFISKAPDEVVNWTDGTNTGVSLIVKIICHLLSPLSPEMSACMVGRLIFVLLKRANDAITPYLEQILHDVLGKMYNSELNSTHQSLVMVFAHLIHYQLEPVILFLSSVSTPNGTTALSYVLTLWCEKQKAFFGSYDQKVSSLALCKIFLYAIESPNANLREMTVPGDFNAALKDANSQLQSIPLLVKILKLLIYELDSQLESRCKMAAIANVNVEEDSEEEQGGGDNEARKEDDLTDVLKEIVSGMHGDVDDDVSDENDDPDVADDAISQLDLMQELTNFLVQLSQQPYFQELYQHLTEKERAVLSKVNLAH